MIPTWHTALLFIPWLGSPHYGPMEEPLGDSLLEYDLFIPRYQKLSSVEWLGQENFDRVLLKDSQFFGGLEGNSWCR